MIRLAVFPYARSGIVSAVMLGLGRALGETMAVAMVLSASGVITFNLISSDNPSTIAANIALEFPEATGLRVNALIASGLVLFVHHLRGQLRGPRDRGPRRQERMMARHRPRTAPWRTPRREEPTVSEPPPSGRAARAHLPLSQPRLPAWAPWLVAGVAAARRRWWPCRSAGASSAGSIVAVILFAVALPVWSRLVENRRAAKDRLVTTLVWVGVRGRPAAARLADLRSCSRRACTSSTRSS